MTETRYIPTRELGPDYRLGRCNYCRSRPVYAWHKDTGLRLEDVRCQTCNSTLDRTSREAHGHKTIDGLLAAHYRIEAIKRYETNRQETAEVADAWIKEIDLNPGDEMHVYKCELNADRYLKMAKFYADSIKRLEKAETKAAEAEAEYVAKYNPRHAIEGWQAGYEAQADYRNASIMARALEIQESWRVAS